MLWFLKSSLSDDQLDAIEKRVIAAAEAGSDETALKELRPLARMQRHQPEAAIRLCRIVERRVLPIEKGLEILTRIEEAYPEDAEMLALIGESVEGARDIDQLNAAPPEHPLFLTLVHKLERLADELRGQVLEPRVLAGLSTAARMLARQCDDIAERSYRRLVVLDPENSAYHYNYGLFLKTRGRFEEGMRANRAAASLVRRPVESYDWNLGICATGAGDGAAALEVWQRLAQKIAMGRFDLPEGGYPQCKVRLAQRPLAERDAASDDPGLEETIWIERLSPAHGIVRSVLYQDLGVDYGDVVLIDGAPITYHSYGDIEVPVFPHLATLVRSGYRFFDFAGTQKEAGQLEDISRDLDGDAIVYSHTESVEMLCAACWRDPETDHELHDKEQKNIVTGRIAAPAACDPARLLQQLDEGVSGRSQCSLYVPDLCRRAGFTERASVDRKRMDMLKNN